MKLNKKLPKAARSTAVEARENFATKLASIHWQTALQALIIAAAALWIYWSAIHGGWIWDDDVLVTDNSDLHSLHGLWKIWFATPKTDYWPLTWTLFWINWHLWGNDPFGYHLCGLALHICSGFLIWRLLNRLGLRWGWLGGLLFVIHPLAVESVAWISEIKNTLSLPFFLLSCNAWLDAEDNKSFGYWRSVFYYLAAMLAKTSTVMLPLVLLLYCWWKRGRVTRQEFKRMIPYLVITVTLGLLTVYSQNTGEGGSPVALGGFVTRLIGAGTIVFFYLAKFILPINLLPIYPRWTFDPPSLLQILTIPALAGLLFGLWTQRRSWGRHALFGFGFFFLNLLPVLGLVKIKYLDISWVADHLVYLPMIGLVGLVVAGLAQCYDQLPSSPYLLPIGTMVMAAVTGLLSWQSRSYARLFNNDQVLWSYTLQHNPQSLEAHANLARVLMQTGHLPEAIDQFEQVVKANPDVAVAHYNLGTALKSTGRVSEATEQFEQALKIKPDFAPALFALGNVAMRKGRVSDAIEQFEQVLRTHPEFAAAHNNLGTAFELTGRVSEAIEQFEQAVKIDPAFAEGHKNLGTALAMTGRLPEAIEQFEQALKIKPDYAGARRNLAKAQELLKSSPAKK